MELKGSFLLEYQNYSSVKNKEGDSDVSGIPFHSNLQTTKEYNKLCQLLFLNPAMLSFSDNEFNRLATLNEH